MPNRQWDAVTWGPPIALLLFVMALNIQLGLRGKYEDDMGREWWARMTGWVLLFGAVITAFSALPFFPFKFIAPGAVMVSGNLSESRSGKVSWIGPLTNLAMGTGFLLSYLILETAVGSANKILLAGVWFNGFIAFFNLIPFMGLDGQKIFGWNKLVWVLTFAAAIGLYIGGDYLSGGGIIGFLRRFF